MKTTLGVLFFLGLSQISQASETRYLLIPSHTPILTRDLLPEDVLFTDEGVSVVKVPMAQIENWSTRVHETLGGCGGFIDVTHEIEEGRSPITLVWNELEINRQASSRKNYFAATTRNTAITALVAGANSTELWSFLTELSSFPDRSATTENGKKAALYLKQQAETLLGHLPGLKTELIETGMAYIQPSVLVTLTGSDPSLPGVVIGGHMDTFTNGKPGADDDGSGTAVVREAIRVIGLQNAKFKRTIHFVWYAAEERGLVGSSYIVKHFQNNNIPVHAAIQFDMTGYNSEEEDEDIFLITDYTDPALTTKLRTLIETYTTAKVATTRCGYACSDHANWHRAGIPAVFPFEARFENMNHRLHTGEDKISFLDSEHAHKFSQTALAFLGEMAEIESR